MHGKFFIQPCMPERRPHQHDSVSAPQNMMSGGAIAFLPADATDIWRTYHISDWWMGTTLIQYKQSTVSNLKLTLGTRKERKLPEGMHLNLGCSWYRVSWYGWSCSTQSYPVMIRIRTASCCRTMRGTLGSHLVSMREEPPWWCHSI